MLSPKDIDYAIISIVDIQRALEILEDKLNEIAGVKNKFYVYDTRNFFQKCLIFFLFCLYIVVKDIKITNLKTENDEYRILCIKRASIWCL